MAFSRSGVSAVLLALCLTFAASTGEAARSLQQTGNLVTLIASQPQLSTLGAAVKAANLTSFLDNPALNVTVFAPTNEAFAQLIANMNTTASALLANTNFVKAVLQYHVVPGALKASALKSDQVLTTYLGQTVTVMIEGKSIVIDGYGSMAPVIQTDIVSNSAIVDIVSEVLVPKI